MIQAAIILDELYAALDATDNDDKKDVLRTLNIAYQEEARQASWCEMRRSMTASHGSIIPANAIGINGVYDALGNVYSPREKRNLGTINQDTVKRWYFSSFASSALVHQKGATIAQGSDSVAFSPPLSIDPTGEIIVFDNDIGMYEMASASTITRKYMGSAIQSGWFKIRPEGTKTLGLMDEDNDDDTTSVTVDYWTLPPPIHHDSDMILLPMAEALLLRTLRRYYKIHKQDLPTAGTFNDEYAEAHEAAKLMNPIYAAPSVPRNTMGRHAGFGSELT